MDILKFLSTVIGYLAWPIVVVSMLCLFRSPLTELINAIKEAKFKISKGETTIEAELNTVHEIIQEVPIISKEAKKIAVESPTKVIEYSWKELENALNSKSISTALPPMKIAVSLVDKYILDEREAEAFYKLSEIKDKALKPEYKYMFDVSSASTYSSLATSMADIITKKSS